MEYKLLILDLDGTTVAPGFDTTPSQSVVEAIRVAQKTIKVSIATGRPLKSTLHIIDKLGLNGLGVLNNGAEIYDLSSRELIYSKKMTKSQLQDMIKIALPFGYEIFSTEDNFQEVIKSREEINGDTEKLFIKAIKSSEALQLVEELESVKGVAAHTTKSWMPGDVVDIHATHEHGTKRYGVEKLIELLEIDRSQVMAIGDDHNDVPLMMAAGHSVAMGDAPKQVKELADYVTGTLEEDGVAQAIEKFILT